MSQIGYLERGELVVHAGYLGDDMREMAEAYREDLADLKSQIPEQKTEIKELKQNLLNCSEGERKGIEKEIKWADEAMEALLADIEETKREQAEFKKDKRSFLVKYINNQTQDDDWE
jgi:predicted RNase H-like nuclease (RuvC/YqgF family)